MDDQWLQSRRVDNLFSSLYSLRFSAGESFVSPVDVKRETFEVELLVIRNISVTLKFKPLLVCLVRILRSLDVLGDSICCHNWMTGRIGHEEELLYRKGD